MQGIVGVDEVGRGPLAGPVVAAAVMFKPEYPPLAVKDSKALSPKKRELLYQQIIEQTHWALGEASVEEIDEINILQASLLAMRRAILNLDITPSKVLVDGNQCPTVPYPTLAIIKGDQTVPQISAASILAKVVRDRMMITLDAQYPLYGFKSHKGYPTAQHMAALKEYGPLSIHRRSFKPVADCLKSFKFEGA